MSRIPRRRMPPAAGRTPVESLEIQSFSRRLHDALTQAGMNQSDLARAVWGETTDSKGRPVAKNRDRISQYLAGKSVQANLAKIADALGVDLLDLAPDITAATIEREDPAFQVTLVTGHDDRTHLRVNALVEFKVAQEVMRILAEAGVGKAKAPAPAPIQAATNAQPEIKTETP